MTLRATISQIGSLRLTRYRDRRVNVKARLSLSTSSGLILPSLNSRLIGIVAPAGCDPTTELCSRSGKYGARCTLGVARQIAKGRSASEAPVAPGLCILLDSSRIL